jgi:hypothetical protein
MHSFIDRRRWRLPGVVARVVLTLGLTAAMPSTTLAAAGYVIVASEATRGDEDWGRVIDALQKKHARLGVVVLTHRGDPAEVTGDLREIMPRFTCFVTTPAETTRQAVAGIHQLTRDLHDDPYTDTLWGILTGFDAAGALAIASHAEPLEVRRVTSGTEIAMDRVVEGAWFDELRAGHMVRKAAGGEPQEIRCEPDTTARIAGRLETGQTELFITSGHATERDWQIGYGYRNGQFRSQGGKLFGVDTNGRRFPIRSDNPKAWLPVGNCLAGHIDGPDALALALMHAAGVHQMIGYTVPTWYGYAGWGVLDYFLEQPGRYTLTEAFHANGHALIHRLTQLEAAGQGAPARDLRGLRFDRDVVGFYGDPAWEVRMADGPQNFRQTLTENDGCFTLLVEPLAGDESFKPVSTNGSQRGGRPIVAFLPRRVGTTELIEGADLGAVVTDRFVLLPRPDKARSLRVVFRPRP